MGRKRDHSLRPNWRKRAIRLGGRAGCIEMKASPRENAEVYLTENGRKISIEIHRDFKDSISTHSRNFDFIDESCELSDDQITVDPYECHAPSRRSDKDLGRLLNLLDSLETGNDRKEITR